MEWEKENKMICDVFNDLPWHVCEPVSTEDTFNTQGTNKTILANRIYPQSSVIPNTFDVASAVTPNFWVTFKSSGALNLVYYNPQKTNWKISQFVVRT